MAKIFVPSGLHSITKLDKAMKFPPVDAPTPWSPKREQQNTAEYGIRRDSNLRLPGIPQGVNLIQNGTTLSPDVTNDARKLIARAPLPHTHRYPMGSEDYLNEGVGKLRAQDEVSRHANLINTQPDLAHATPDEINMVADGRRPDGSYIDNAGRSILPIKDPHNLVAIDQAMEDPNSKTPIRVRGSLASLIVRARQHAQSHRAPGPNHPETKYNEANAHRDPTVTSNLHQ